MRKSIIAGNWKMNFNKEETIDFTKELLKLNNNSNGEVVLCVPFTSISTVDELIKDSNIKLGAQNMYFEDSGAYTGEISGSMLKSYGVEYVIIGHSERREFFKETDEIVNKKVLKTLESDLKPILCVGESLEEREGERHFEVVKNQLEKDLTGISEDKLENIVIAYEPIWAIGTGKSASSDDAEEMCKYIRNVIKDLYSEDISDKIRIQYGGSVKPNTIDELMKKENIDGALVGGASLVPEDFVRIISYEVVNE